MQAQVLCFDPELAQTTQCCTLASQVIHFWN